MLLRWNPTDYTAFGRDMRAIQRQMDAVFADLLPLGRKRTPIRYRLHEGPSFNVAEQDDKYVVEAELPGVAHEDLQIDATGRELTVKGKRTVTAPEGYETLRSERAASEFSRTLRFEHKLDLEKVSARLQRGILRIELTKQAAEQPRAITVKVA